MRLVRPAPTLALLLLTVALLASCADTDTEPSAAGFDDEAGLMDDALFDSDAPPIYELATTHRQVVYVNFDGPRIDDCDNYCSDAATNRSWAIGAHFGRSSIDFAPFGRGQADKDAIVATLRRAFSPYDVDVTAERPSSGPYTMVVVSTSDVGPAKGVAPLDCDNRNPNDIGFVYGIGRISTGWIAQAAAHEMGHSFGLSHVASRADFMDWTSAGDDFTRAAYDHDHASGKCFEGDVQDGPAMLVAALGGRSPEPPETWDGAFADDDGSPHEAAIEAIASAGITTGCTGGAAPRFCPGDPVTRGQMVVFLQRALDLPASGTDWFSDDDGAWYEGAANAAADAGITLGCGEGGRFCGQAVISRAQMASFLARALDYPASSTDHFSDDDGNPHEASINALADAGVTTGCGPEGHYCPGDEVTRGQMASFLARALNL